MLCNNQLKFVFLGPCNQYSCITLFSSFPPPLPSPPLPSPPLSLPSLPSPPLPPFPSLLLSHVSMEHEVACVDITPLGEGREKADLCAVGLWTEISVRMLQLPSLEAMYTQLLGGGEGEHIYTLCVRFKLPSGFCLLGSKRQFRPSSSPHCDQI